MHDISVDEKGVALLHFQFLIGRVDPEGPCLHIIQLDLVVPVPRDMLSREQPAFIKHAHEGQTAGSFRQQLLAVVAECQIFFLMIDHVEIPLFFCPDYYILA